MNYSNLFSNGSLKFVRDLVSKIVYQGLNAPFNAKMEQVVVLISALIVIFLLYKLVWLVWTTLKFLISCLEW